MAIVSLPAVYYEDEKVEEDKVKVDNMEVEEDGTVINGPKHHRD